MGTTVQQLRDLIEGEDVVAFLREELLIIPTGHEGDTLNLYVNVCDEGTYVRWYMPYFLRLPHGRRGNQVCARLLELNRNIKFLKFGVDTSTGDITAEIDLAVGDKLHLVDVQRCLFFMLNVALTERTGLKQLIRTGKFPAGQYEMDAVARRLLESADGDETLSLGPFEDQEP
ncbi:MAG TPA: hypothetical protein VGS41_10970 [Chthonomonadales bacterium]|nr:hypothetical protein [Chthonomonadales bacterium]